MINLTSAHQQLSDSRIPKRFGNVTLRCKKWLGLLDFTLQNAIAALISFFATHLAISTEWGKWIIEVGTSNQDISDLTNLRSFFGETMGLMLSINITASFLFYSLVYLRFNRCNSNYKKTKPWIAGTREILSFITDFYIAKTAIFVSLGIGICSAIYFSIDVLELSDNKRRAVSNYYFRTLLIGIGSLLFVAYYRVTNLFDTEQLKDTNYWFTKFLSHPINNVLLSCILLSVLGILMMIFFIKIKGNLELLLSIWHITTDVVIPTTTYSLFLPPT
jgi:hypothetical protein